MKKVITITLIVLGSSFLNYCQGQYIDIHNFNGVTGEAPYGSLVLSGSKLFGMTSVGGTGNYGVVFSVDTNGNNYKNILNFNGTNGKNPHGSLTLSGSKLFGMTSAGGTSNLGLVFSIDTNGNNYKDILNFNGTNGLTPKGSLLLYRNKLYGMVSGGGILDSGTVFSLDTNGSNYKDIFNFNYTHGYAPFGSLIYASGILYGMTSAGGTSNYGVVFSVDTNGNNYKDILNFNGTLNGKAPQGSLIRSGAKLFGMVSENGPGAFGLAFAIDTNGSNYKDLLDFNGTNKGGTPYGDLILSGNNLFGMASRGGTSGYGVAFSIDTDGSNYMDILNFNGTNGEAPYGSLILSGNVLFGMVSQHGPGGYGVVFGIRDSAIKIDNSINELVSNSGVISIYPSPSNGTFTLSLSKINEKCIVEIYNVLGENIYRTALSSNNTKINLSGQPKGIYFYRVLEKEGNIVGSGKVLIEK